MEKTHERWKNSIDFLTILPEKEIIEIIGLKPNFKIYIDEQIKERDLSSYNMPIMVRAFNEGLFNLYDYMHLEEFDKKANIKIPQVLIEDSLGYKESVITIHIAKLNKEELLINDICLRRNMSKPLGNGVFQEVIRRLKKMCEEEGIKYISGHATNEWALEKFIKNGFQKDFRKEMNNDKLWEAAKYNGRQLPFYLKIN